MFSWYKPPLFLKILWLWISCTNMFSYLKFVKRLVIYFLNNDWNTTVNTSCLKSEPGERLVSHAEVCASLEWPKHGRIGSVGNHKVQTGNVNLGNSPFSLTLSCGKCRDDCDWSGRNWCWLQLCTAVVSNAHSVLSQSNSAMLEWSLHCPFLVLYLACADWDAII